MPQVSPEPRSKARAAAPRAHVRASLLAPRPESCERARALLARVPELASSPRLADAQLLVSELLANSVMHAGLREGERIRLETIVRGSRLRIEVADPGGGFFSARGSPEPREFGGWGLRLVDQLSERWGVLCERRTHVWFELELGR